MGLTKARSASFQSYGSIPTSDVDYIETMEEGNSYHSHPQVEDSFMLNQLSNRNTRVFGGVVASLALFMVMVGLFNNSSPAKSNSEIIQRDSKLFGKYERMAKSGRYMFAAEEPAKKEGKAKEEGEKPKEVAEAKEEPAKKEAAPEKVEAKADKKEESHGNSADSEKRERHEKAAKEHSAAADQWEKAAAIGARYEKKAQDAVKNEEKEQNYWRRKYESMAKKWTDPSEWMN